MALISLRNKNPRHLLIPVKRKPLVTYPYKYPHIFDSKWVTRVECKPRIVSWVFILTIAGKKSFCDCVIQVRFHTAKNLLSTIESAQAGGVFFATAVLSQASIPGPHKQTVCLLRQGLEGD